MIKNMNFNDANFELNSHKECLRRPHWPDGDFITAREPDTVPLEVIPKMRSLTESAKHIVLSRKEPLKFTNQVTYINASNEATDYQFTIEDINASDWETIKTV